MKRFGLFVMLLLSVSTMVYGQRSSKKNAVAVAPQKAADDIVLVVSGTGATKEDATAVALRSAIEQAFGTFVSANTTILNDELVRDEIATITSGNIKSFKELASIQDEAGVYHVSVSAVVSIGKLISYAQAHGSSAEFSGQTFMMNVKMRELNKQNEAEALANLIDQLQIMQNNLFDFEIQTKEPRQKDDGWSVPVELTIRPNKNYVSFIDLLVSTLSSLSLSRIEKLQYEANNMELYCYRIDDLVNSLEMIDKDFRSPTFNNTNALDFYLRNDPTFFSYDLTKLYMEALASFMIKTRGGKEKIAYLTDYEGFPTFGFYPAQRGYINTPGIYHYWRFGLTKIFNFEFDTASLYELEGFEVVRVPVAKIQTNRIAAILDHLSIHYRMSDNNDMIVFEVSDGGKQVFVGVRSCWMMIPNNPNPVDMDDYSIHYCIPYEGKQRNDVFTLIDKSSKSVTFISISDDQNKRTLYKW